jgi:hypothetical protein
MWPNLTCHKKKKKKIKNNFFSSLLPISNPKISLPNFLTKTLSLRSQNSYISICIYIHIRKGLFEFSDIHDFGETEALIEWCKYQHHGFSPKGLKFI